MNAFFFADDLHLSVKLQPALRLGLGFDEGDEFQHVGSRRAVVVHDKIAMHFRDFRPTDSRAF